MIKRKRSAAAVVFVSIAMICGIYFMALSFKRTKYENHIFRIPENLSVLPSINADDICYLFDPDDKKLMSGYSDYTAVAVVSKIVGTSYENVKIQFDGTVTGTPYTNYEVEIIRNIKGKLKSDRSVPLAEYGGISIDGKYLENIYTLLEQGECYVLYLTAAENGALYLNKAYQIPDDALEKNQAGETIGIKEESAIQEYLDAYSHEDLQYAPANRSVNAYDEGEYNYSNLTKIITVLNLIHKRDMIISGIIIRLPIF